MAGNPHPEWARQLTAYQNGQPVHPSWWRQYSLLQGATSGVSFWPADNNGVFTGATENYVVQLGAPAGNVTKVELLRFTDFSAQTLAEVLDTDSTSPFSVSWTPTSTGTFFLGLRATNDQAATSLSAVFPVVVTGNSGSNNAFPYTFPFNLA